MLSFPNAKINIGLNVVEKRPDGYHNLETIFYPAAVKDALEIIIHKEQKQEYTFFNSGLQIDASAEDNICIKALQLLKSDFEIPPVEFHLHKAIPFGAGLGGGSADAAFTLKMLNELCHLGLNREQLKTMARQLGADCAFFIDNKAAFAGGIGDELTPLNLDLSAYHLVLVKPPVHVSTPEAYAGVHPKAPATDLKQAISQPLEEWRHLIQNDFEASVFRKHPQIKAIKTQLYAEGAAYAAMSGSGSSVYGIFREPVDLSFPAPHFVWSGPMP